MASFEEKKRQKENLAQLDEEAAGREARIKNRRQHQNKIDAKRKFKKRLKMIGLSVGLLVAGVYALTWFSKDFVDWLHKLIN